MQRLSQYRRRELPTKFDTALQLIDEQVRNELKTVVWTSFIKNIDQFGELCRRRFDVPVLTVDGRVPVEGDSPAISPEDPGAMPLS